ncbi:TlpA family protein disulfide reductase [Porticoccus sp. GXU_MW_L64]
MTLCPLAKAFALALLLIHWPLQADVDTGSREDAIRAIENMYRATERNQEKIRRAIADRNAGKITDQEYRAGRSERRWPDYQSIFDQVIPVYRQNPADDHAITAMTYMLKKLPAVYNRDQANEKAFARRVEIADLLLKFHVNRPGIWESMRYLGLPDAIKFDYFQQYYSHSNNPNTRVQAALAVVQYFVRQTTELALPREERKRYREKANMLLAEVKGQIGEEAVDDLKRVDNLLAQLGSVVGQPLAGINTVNLNGDADSLSNYRGKVVLIDLWATWCSPCKEAIPALREITEELVGRPFQMVSASVDDEAQTVVGYIEEEQAMPWVHWHLGPEQQQISGITHYPTYLIVDEQGILRAKLVGNNSEHRIREELLRLVALAEGD